MVREVIVILPILSLLNIGIYLESEIKFEKYTYHFGNIIMGDTATARLRFSTARIMNALAIKAESSCECIRARLNNSIYGPNETGYLDVSFDSIGYKGEFRRSVSILSSVDGRELAILNFTGKVILQRSPDPYIDPKDISFGHIKIKGIYAKEIIIRNIGDVDLIISEVQHSPEIILIINRDIIKPGDRDTLILILRPLKVGSHRSVVRIRTNYSLGPPSEVRIAAEVQGSISKVATSSASKR